MIRSQRLAPILLSLLLLGGCGGVKRVERSETTSAADELATYEADFRPSDYDPDPKAIFREVRKEDEKKHSPSEVPPVNEAPLFVSGFRVQLYATTDIDEVNTKKAAAESAFRDEHFYVVYDPPAYKLRAGNFLSRTDAEDFALRLQVAGYPDAWVVPDRVVKNAPPRQDQNDRR